MHMHALINKKKHAKHPHKKRKENCVYISAVKITMLTQAIHFSSLMALENI